MSEIKVNKVTPRVACGTTQLGDSGDTFTIPSGATISNLGTATGFGGTGVVSWDTGSIKTTGFTAVTGTGYFCDTTGGAFTVTLPLSPAAGAVVGVADYAQTFLTNNLTLGRNGSNIGGTAVDSIISTGGIALTLVYVDATKGWIVTDSGNQDDAQGPLFVAGTGGCITTCGNFKMHKFTGPNSFIVSCAGNSGGSNSVDYMVVAGGGGGGGSHGGGGGAGGYRESPGTASGCYTASPLGVSPAAAIVVSETSYGIIVGGGGTGGAGGPTGRTPGVSGSNSSFSTITSTAGGGGGAGTCASTYVGLDGGSGGGGGSPNSAGTGAGGSGDTPPAPVAQGKDGGTGAHDAASFAAGGGGGGATVAGTSLVTSPVSPTAGPGGAGATTSIDATPTARGGGGGGGAHPANPGGGGTGGAGGGGPGGNTSGVAGCAGTINTGSGAGGGGGTTGVGGLGGSGIVVIRYKYQ